MNERQAETLSAAGEARRKAMLDELVRFGRREHRLRRVRRRVLSAAAGASALLLAFWLGWPREAAPPASFPIVDSAAEAAGSLGVGDSPERPCVTLRIATDHSILERYRVQPRQQITRLDDATLLETLASIHRPAELVHVHGRPRLSSPVTDDELGISQ